MALNERQKLSMVGNRLFIILWPLAIALLLLGKYGGRKLNRFPSDNTIFPGVLVFLCVLTMRSLMYVI